MKKRKFLPLVFLGIICIACQNAGTATVANDTEAAAERHASVEDLFNRKVEVDFAYKIFLMIPDSLTYKGIKALDDRNGCYQDLDVNHHLKNPLHLAQKSFCGSMMELVNMHCYPMSNGDYKIYYAKLDDDNDHSDESVDDYTYSASDIHAFIYHDGKLKETDFDLKNANGYRFGDRHIEIDGAKCTWDGKNFAK